MQRFNFKLADHLRKKISFYLVAWGGSQIYLPIFLIVAFVKSVLICFTKNITIIYVSDGLLSPLGLLLRIITKKPVAVSVHGRDIAFRFRPYQIIIPWCLKHLDKVICVSDALKRECKQKGVEANKLCVIPNGIDINDFTETDNDIALTLLRNTFGKDIKDKKILLSVCRLVPKKGIGLFINNVFSRLVKKHPSLLYIVVGDGPQKKVIKGIISKLGLTNSVILAGAIPMQSDLLKNIYSLADIFVMPNRPVKDDMEGFGIVCLEAAASKLPVVACNIDGISQAVSEGNSGFLIDHKNNDAFVEKIDQLLTNHDYCVDFGKKAREYVARNYSWDKISQQYIDILEKMVPHKHQIL